jgi:pectate lyase
LFELKYPMPYFSGRALKHCSSLALGLTGLLGCGSASDPGSQPASNGGAPSIAGSSSGGVAPTAGAPNGGSSPSAGGALPANGGAPARAGAGGSGAGGSAPGGSGNAAAGAAGSKATGGAGAGGAGSCLNPAAPGPVEGWASVNGMNQNGTTGGGNATPIVVTNLATFKSAVSGTAPAVVYLNAKLANGSVAIGSNKTVVGVCGAEFHGHLGISKASNVILRNLKIVGYGVGDCTKDPSFDASVGCSSGADAVSITSASHHVWVDHCDISDGTDGNLDINAGSDFITISWTKFYYSPRTDNVGNDSTGAEGHRFSNLIGSADDVPEDVGHLNVTWHHDWWADNVNQRMPRTRHGQIHVVNNLFTSTGNSYCTNAGYQSHLLVENNVYVGVKNPLQPDANGDMLAQNNVFTNTSGTNKATGQGFTPTYKYTPEATGALATSIMSGAGPH